jgi:hypothetical protein
MQTEQGRQGLRTYLEKGVRLEYLVEANYDKSKDGKLILKPELAEQMKDAFSQAPK